MGHMKYVAILGMSLIILCLVLSGCQSTPVKPTDDDGSTDQAPSSSGSTLPQKSRLQHLTHKVNQRETPSEIVAIYYGRNSAYTNVDYGSDKQKMLLWKAILLVNGKKSAADVHPGDILTIPPIILPNGHILNPADPNQPDKSKFISHQKRNANQLARLRKQNTRPMIKAHTGSEPHKEKPPEDEPPEDPCKTVTCEPGKSLFIAGRYWEALKALDRTNCPQCADIRNHCEIAQQARIDAEELYYQGNYATAKQKFETVLNLNPNDSFSKNGLSKCDHYIEIGHKGPPDDGLGPESPCSRNRYNQFISRVMEFCNKGDMASVEQEKKEISEWRNAHPQCRQTETQIIGHIFEEGLRLFKQGQFDQAIPKMKQLLCLDVAEPMNADAQNVVNVSETILQGIRLSRDQRHIRKAITTLQSVLYTTIQDKLPHEQYVKKRLYEIYQQAIESAVRQLAKRNYDLRIFRQLMNDIQKVSQYCNEFSDGNCSRYDSVKVQAEKDYKAFHYKKAESYFKDKRFCEALHHYRLIHQIDKGYLDIDEPIEFILKKIKRREIDCSSEPQ